MSRNIDTSGKTSISGGQIAARQGGKMLFTTYNGQKAAFFVRNDRLRAVRLFPRVRSKIGAVYICKVKNAVRNLDAYFVEIGGEEREICFLSKRDAAHPFLLNRVWDGRILEGDEFPVQVTRDAVKTKQASVTTLISLSNPYFALSVGNTKPGYSSKFGIEQKALFKQIFSGQKLEMPRLLLPMQAAGGGAEKILPAGFVARTKSAELLQTAEPAADIVSRWQDIVSQWEGLFQAARHRACFSCLLEAPMPWEAALDQLVYPYEYEEIVTDDRALYEQLLALPDVPPDKNIRFYDEEQNVRFSLTKLYGLESKMDTALSRRVWLKSGGYLVIDPTEALTVIDVNSGRNESRKAAEEIYAQTNREAAEEIALQLRLRNLSGMILVDFINMKSAKQQEELLDYLKELVKNDKQKTIIVDMTALGLVEITRKKESKPLAEQLEGGRSDRGKK